MNIKKIKKYILPFVFIISASATLGSLYFSEVMKLPPCSLCWYQRAMMYPIPLVMVVGLFRNDKNSVFFALPLAIVGLIIATYHNLLYYHLIPESVQPCTTGISCTIKQIEWFGFISIPLLSLTAFGVIIASLLLYHKLFLRKN
ncbi:MAG: disulfide bond formation protein B [Candidatus Levybacteria bacterium]|nr:disulfide bond formation protein B [Candidatus Levybacteria bacterium]